jgi:hypothetical protein
MRVLGLALFVVMAAATGYAVRASFERPPRVAAAFGLAAALTVLLALLGLLLLFVPGFMS